MRQPNQRLNSMQGFTLVELIITISVAAILLTISVPAFRALTRTFQLSTQANIFVTSVNVSRAESIRRSRRVTLCPSADGTGCAASGNWDQGWIVFVDLDNDAARDAGEDLIAVHGALEGGLTLIGDSDVSNYISFRSDGTSRLANGTSFQSGTITLCQEDRGIDIVLSPTGRISTVDPSANCP